MDEATDRVVAGRTALAVSRWLLDNGYAHKDLSWLPGLGARIVAVTRVDATTLRLRLDDPLGPTDAKIHVDYTLWPSYLGAGSLVTDNWQASGAKRARGRRPRFPRSLFFTFPSFPRLDCLYVHVG